MTTSCLIEAPDEVVLPEQIPPRALVDGADPALIWPVQTTNNPQPFLVPFVSEDLGEPVLGRLYLNYQGQVDVRLISSSIRVGGTAKDLERSMEVIWANPGSVAAGCYSVTMTIAHASNYSPETLVPIDASRTAFVTWWVVNGTAPEMVNLDECGPARMQQ